MHQEYVNRAKEADRKYNGAQEEIGRVELKLLSYPPVVGLVFGNWGEASEGVHTLVEQLAISRVSVAEPQSRNKGGALTEEGVKAQAVGFIRRRMSIAAVRAQCISLLGRMGPGLTAASGRRRAALEQDAIWRRERNTHKVAFNGEAR